MDIITFNKSLLRVNEIPEVVNGIVEIIEKHNPALLGLEPIYNLLVDSQSQLGLLSVSNTGHPLTGSIRKSRARRNELGKAIVIQLRAVEKADVSVQRDPVFKMKPLISGLLMKINTVNSKTADSNASVFLAKLSQSEELRQAATAIGIDSIVEEMKVVQSLLESEVTIRLNNQSERRIIREKELRKSTLKTISNLMKAIELAMLTSEVDYTSVVSELNQFLVPYKALTRGRVTRNTNATINKETVASSTTTTATAL